MLTEILLTFKAGIDQLSLTGFHSIKVEWAMGYDFLDMVISAQIFRITTMIYMANTSI